MFNHFIKIAVCVMVLSIPTVLTANTYNTWNDKEKERPEITLPRRSGYLPTAAFNAVTKLNEQLDRMFAEISSQGAVRIVCTVPVNVNDFEKSNPLSRQMAEEMALFFVERGYLVQEIRRGTQIVMNPQQGEFFLTRDTDQLLRSDVDSELVLTGTYSMSSRGIRYNFKVLHAQNADILAMASVTVPVHKEIRELLLENAPERVLTPRVGTRLP